MLQSTKAPHRVALTLALGLALAGCAQTGGGGGGLFGGGGPQPRVVDLATGQCPQPQYPAAALNARATGVSTVRFQVNAEGEVTDAVIARSAGNSREHQLLDAAAVALVKQCRFPAARGTLPGTAAAEYNWGLK